MWRQLIQLPRMIGSEMSQNQIAFSRDTQDCAPLISGVLSTFEQSLTLRSIHKLNGAVVLQSQSLGSISYRHHCSLGSPSHLQEKLVLFRLQSCAQRRAFAEMQKAAQFKTKLSQSAEQRVNPERSSSDFHVNIVSRYIASRRAFPLLYIYPCYWQAHAGRSISSVLPRMSYRWSSNDC